jgi:hypothetical protein
VNGVKNPSSCRQSFLWWIIVGAFILFGLVALVFGLREVWFGWKSGSWPAAEGIVQSSSVKHTTGRHGGYMVEVRYRFTVDGREHAGTRIDFGGDAVSSDLSPAKTIADMYSAGATITVYYQPDSPAVCVLEPGLKGHAWFIPAFGLFFLALGCAGVALTPRYFRYLAARAARQQVAVQEVEEEFRHLATTIAEGHIKEAYRKVVPPRAARRAFFQAQVRSWSPARRFLQARVFPLPFILFGLLILYMWASAKSVSDSWVVLAFGIGFLAAGLLVAVLMPRAIRRALAASDPPPPPDGG